MRLRGPGLPVWEQARRGLGAEVMQAVVERVMAPEG